MNLCQTRERKNKSVDAEVKNSRELPKERRLSETARPSSRRLSLKTDLYAESCVLFIASPAGGARLILLIKPVLAFMNLRIWTLGLYIYIYIKK